MTDTSKSQDSLSSSISYNEDITILPSQRLTHLDKSPVKAYAARGTGRLPQALYVLVCEDHLTPRWHTGNKYAAVSNPAANRLIASGPVFWPSEGKEKYVLIYENNLGQQLMKDDTTGGLGMKQDLAMSAIIQPMILLLQDFKDKEIVHGAIRPSNMFDGGAINLDKVILGECLCMPASSSMPALYETIERAMTDPVARGLGSFANDLYSFGVSIAVLLRSTDPLEGLSADEIIRRKLEFGSFSTLIGSDRLGGSALDLLRGLLQDEAEQRWTLEDVHSWMDGRRLNPKQGIKKNKAARPLIFNNDKYLRPETLAHHMPHNVAEAAQLIESGELDQWIHRAIDSAPLRKQVEGAIGMATETGKQPGYMEKLVTRVCIALDAVAPVRFKSLRMLPDGVGNALTAAYVQRKDITHYVEFLQDNFFLQWVNGQSNPSVDIGSVVSRFDSCRTFIRQTSVGFGLERCIYLLNPETRCLSEKLKNFYVRGPEDLLMAVERISRMPKRPQFIFDRHIIAFLSVKDRKSIDLFFGDLNAAEHYKKILGELRTLATIQKRSKLPPCPGTADWLADNLDLVLERLHDRDLRKVVASKVNKVKESGDLGKISAIFDDISLYQNDEGMFRLAMNEYYELKKERGILQRKMESEKDYGFDAGRQYAALLSAILASIVIVASAFMAFAGVLKIN